MKRNNEGFSLVEIVAAIAILGILVAPVCASLIFGLRLNEKTDAQLKAQLSVSSTVETLMAEGIVDPTADYSTDEVSVTITEQKDGETHLPYYQVIVSSTQGRTETVISDDGNGEQTETTVFVPLCSVTTYIREAVTEP